MSSSFTFYTFHSHHFHYCNHCNSVASFDLRSSISSIVRHNRTLVTLQQYLLRQLTGAIRRRGTSDQSTNGNPSTSVTKVKSTLLRAMKANGGSRGVALLFL